MKNILVSIMFLFSTLAFNSAMSANAVVPDIEGKVVVDSTGAKVGDVDRVATTGTETVVVIGLSDSQKEVAIPLNSVTVAANGTVMTNLTKAQLETYEDIDPLDFTKVK